MDNVRKEFEETALQGCKAVRAFLAYQGDNKVYALKARAGAVAMGSYSRLRATMANERALDLAGRKALARAADSRPLLSGGSAAAALISAREDDAAS